MGQVEREAEVAERAVRAGRRAERVAEPGRDAGLRQGRRRGAHHRQRRASGRCVFIRLLQFVYVMDALQNVGLAALLPSLALGLTGVVGAFPAFIIFQSASRD
jgi:hypothetical protein